MNKTTLYRLARRTATFGATLAIAVGLSLTAPRDAQALTIVLDFSAGPKTDIFGETTIGFDSSTYGFSGLNQTQAENSVLAAVTHHYLAYPTVGVDASSPLADGKELDIDFEIGSGGAAPTNGDTEYWYMGIGTGTAGTAATDASILGQACLDCVHDSAGTVNKFGMGAGTYVGSIFTDHISGLAGLAGNDTELINLIAGTISHEIGHSLSLIHTGAQAANPGASAWGVMGSGATSMPNAERVKQREFTYANFGQLIGAVGVRDTTTGGGTGGGSGGTTGSVPEPGVLVLLGGGLALLGFRRRRDA